MLPRELLRAVRRIAGAGRLAGMDIVEVSPPYDHAEVTAMAANRVALEAHLARSPRSSRPGHPVRFEGADAAPSPRARARTPPARRPITRR